MMSGFAWLLLTGVAAFWLACTIIVAMIGVAAHRNDPRVVIPDPYERPSHQLAWDSLRTAVLRAREDLEREHADFATWEREVRMRRHRRAA
jgi:hypothetical protein